MKLPSAAQTQLDAAHTIAQLCILGFHIVVSVASAAIIAKEDLVCQHHFVVFVA